jgi:hypothetical protein
VDDVAALQAAADRLRPEIIRQRLDYWTLILGPKSQLKSKPRQDEASPSGRTLSSDSLT